jgi:hypothetical protein
MLLTHDFPGGYRRKMMHAGIGMRIRYVVFLPHLKTAAPSKALSSVKLGEDRGKCGGIATIWGEDIIMPDCIQDEMTEN